MPRTTSRRIAGTLLILLAPAVAAGAGAAAFFATAAVTAEVPLLGAAALLTVTAVALAVAVPGWRLRGRPRPLRRAVVFASAVALVCAATFSTTVLRPGPRPAAGPPPPSVRFWDLPTGSRIAYQHHPATGDRRPDPVIFLHGGPGTPGEGLPAVAGVLAGDGFDVYTYDQLGAGRSTRLRDVTGYTVARQVADLEAIRVTLRVERIIPVGQSWGGSLAAQYLAAHPTRVARVAVTSPGPIWPPAWPDGGTGDPWARLTPEQLRRRDEIIEGPRILVQAILQQINPNAAHGLVGDDEADELMHRIAVLGKDTARCPGAPPAAVHGNHQGFYANQMTVADFATVVDPRPRLRLLSVPALIMRGQCDFVPLPVTREYREVLAGSRLVVVPGAGHAIAAEQPAAYTGALRAFLTGGPSAD